jgi:hypothetical protein
METLSGPRVLSLEACDERTAFELPLKGWLSTQVELADGSRYALYFSDPIRLQQDLDEGLQSGTPCFAEPGLIVLPEVTLEAIQEATRFLWQQGFFTKLKPEPAEFAATDADRPDRG